MTGTTAKRMARTGALLRIDPHQGRAGPGPSTTVPGRARSTGIGLHTVEGLRKYVTAGEREAFLRETDRIDRTIKTLCMTLTYAGCCLSEALALTVDRVDLAAGVLTFESLKKRRDGVYRSVPVPPALLDALDMVHGILDKYAGKGRDRGVQLWTARARGWRTIARISWSSAPSVCGPMPPAVLT